MFVEPAGPRSCALGDSAGAATGQARIEYDFKYDRPDEGATSSRAGAAQTISENCVADGGTTNVLSDAFLFQGFCDANDLGNAVSIPTPVDRRSRRAAVESDKDNRYQSAASTQSPLA